MRLHRQLIFDLTRPNNHPLFSSGTRGRSVAVSPFGSCKAPYSSWGNIRVFFLCWQRPRNIYCTRGPGQLRLSRFIERLVSSPPQSDHTNQTNQFLSSQF